MATGEEGRWLPAGDLVQWPEVRWFSLGSAFVWLIFSTSIRVSGLLADGLNPFVSKPCFHLPQSRDRGSAHNLLC